MLNALDCIYIYFPTTERTEKIGGGLIKEIVQGSFPDYKVRNLQVEKVHRVNQNIKF